MVEQIEHYAWRSYPATMGPAACSVWFETDWVLGQFDKTRVVARRRYAAFVFDGAGIPAPWSALRGQALLGSEAFVEKMRPLLEGARDAKEIPRLQRLLHQPTLGWLFTKPFQGDKALRAEAIRKAYLDHGYSMVTIALHAGLHHSTVSKMIKGER